MMRYKILLGTLFILLVGTSCGGSSKDVENVQLESARDNNTQIQSTRPIVEGDRVSTSAADETILLNLQDTLVYTTDFKLHIWHLGVDEQPETIDLWVDGKQIYTDPHEEYIVFGGIKSNQFGLYRLDLETSSIDLIADIPKRAFEK